jgi:hypothetical protein
VHILDCSLGRKFGLGALRKTCIPLGETGTIDRSEDIIKSYQIVLLALAIAMFPRLLTTVGAPKVINFLHFAFVPVALALVYPKMQSYSFKLLSMTLALLGAITLSAFVNTTGLANIVLDFLLLAEPFFLLIAIISIRWSQQSIKRFRLWLLLFAFINVGMAYYQWFVLGDVNDDVKGIYVDMGAGHHIAGAVALSAAAYFLVDFPPIGSRWLRVALGVVVAATFVPVVVFSDTKQAILVFLLSLPILILLTLLNVSKVSNLGKIFCYLAIAVVGVGIAKELGDTVLPGIKHWTTNTDLTMEGLKQKFSVFSIIIQHYSSPLNWLVGLGPGHTVGRLGLMIPDYRAYLLPWGVSTSDIVKEITKIKQANYVTSSKTGSSVWSMTFTWAGVWGDLGLLGLGTYLSLWLVVLRRFCLDDLSRYLLITILVFGIVFDWIEEPGFLLFIVALIGLRWQELQSRERMSYQKRLREFHLAGPRNAEATAHPVSSDQLPSKSLGAHESP